MNANTRLKDLENSLRERGVLDVKFFFQPTTKPLTRVVGDVADALDAVVGGRFDKAPTFNDSVR